MKKQLLLLLSILCAIIFIGVVGICFHKGNSLVAKSLQLTNTKLTPSDWMAMQRAYPHGKINPEAVLESMKQTAALMSKGQKGNELWTFAGPDNIGGRITDIESPQGNSNIIYVGAATGGVLKTSDGGLTWKNLFDNVPVISVGDIAISPGNPNVIWCGTGEANSSSFSFLGNGIYCSTDAGENWQHKGLENSAYIARVIVDYSNTNRVYAAACGNLFTNTDERGIYRTINNGQTWERVLYLTDSTSAVDLVQHPTNPLILYATMWERVRGLTYRRSFGASSGIWKTTDGGTTWSELTNGLPKGNNVGRIGIDIAKSDPDVLYAFYDLENSQVAVYKTINAGVSWIKVDNNALNGMNSNFGWYFGQIRIDPTNTNRVFVMGVQIYRTENGGASWIDVGNSGIHVDHHAMGFTQGNRILEGNDGGLYYSDNSGTSWVKTNNLPLTQFYAIDIDNQSPERIIGGTQDNNTLISRTGNTSNWEPILGGDGMYCLFDHSYSEILYSEYQWGNLFRSTNGGYSMQYIAQSMSGDRVNWSAPLAMHPQNSETLYFGTYRIWKSSNMGDTWQAVSGDLTKGLNNSFSTLSTIDVSPVNTSIVLAGSSDGLVNISSNNGTTWQNISQGLPDRWITRVKADPVDDQTIYVTLSGFRWDEALPHVFKSNNLGQTWVDISGNLPELPVNDIIIDPLDTKRIIVGTDAGVYGTSNGGQTWSWAWQGLPAVPVCALKFHKPSRTIVAGTYGLSAYRATLDDLFTGTLSPKPKNNTSIKISPNPAHDKVWLTFDAPDQDKISICLIDAVNKKIINVFEGNAKVGTNRILCNLENYPAGIYYVSLKGIKTKGGAKLIKL